jgi:hypothetical protein
MTYIPTTYDEIASALNTSRGGPEWSVLQAVHGDRVDMYRATQSAKPPSDDAFREMPDEFPEDAYL